MADDTSPAPRRRSRSRSKGRFSSENKPIRVWCPGSYDFLHCKQINFLRQVKHEMSLRFPKAEVVVGLFSDQDMISKGIRPVFTLNERYDMVRANRWVDDVVKDAPLELSKNVLKEFSCDYAFCMEDGDDYPVTSEYDDLRNELMESGLLKTVSKMGDADFSGISSADLINRLLLKEPVDENNNTMSGQTWKPEKLSFPQSLSCKELLRYSSRKIPKSSDKIVYVSGSFDLLHPGHLKLLEKAHCLGDFLYVGLHSDADISKYAGKNFPIMKWNERAIALLSCKYVSEIIIDAPLKVTDSLIKEFSINCVVPSIDDYGGVDDVNKNLMIEDRYAPAKRRGIFTEIAFDSDALNGSSSADKENPIDVGEVNSTIITTADILARVHRNWNLYLTCTELAEIKKLYKLM